MWPLPCAYFSSMYHFWGLCSLRSPPAHSLQFGSKLLYFSSALYILSYSLLCDILPTFQSGLSCHSGVICLMTVQSEPRRPHSLLVYVKWVRCPLELNNYCCLQLCPFWLSVPVSDLYESEVQGEGGFIGLSCTFICFLHLVFLCFLRSFLLKIAISWRINPSTIM